MPFVRDCQRCRQHGCLAQPSGAAEGAGRNRLEPAGTGWNPLGPAACSAGWPPACPTRRLQPPWCQCPAGHGLSDLWQSLKAQGTTPSLQGVMDSAKPLRTRDKMGENTGNTRRTWPPPELPGAAAGGNQIQPGNQLPDKAGSWCKEELTYKLNFQFANIQGRATATCACMVLQDMSDFLTGVIKQPVPLCFPLLYKCMCGA